MIHLYHAIECPFSARVRLVLAEKKVRYKQTIVNLRHMPEAIEQLNPHGSIPIVEEHGFVVYDSPIIAEYLEERFPTPKLMPRGAVHRARARMLFDPMTILPRLEKELGSQEYLVGDFSLADLMLAPWAMELENADLNVKNWILRLRQRSSIIQDPYFVSIIGMNTTAA